MKLIKVRVSPLEQFISLKIVNKSVFADSDEVKHIIGLNEPNDLQSVANRVVKVSVIPQQIISVKLVNQLDNLNLNNVEYKSLKGLPSLNGIKIVGDKTSDDYGIEEAEALSNMEIEEILSKFI